MTLAPITALFTRSLMLRTRANGVMWARLVLGAVILLALFSSQTGFQRSAPGLQLLSFIAFTSVWVLAVPALTAFASAIAEEKEENTIGLLRMAGLHPLGFLLAKSIARLLEVLVLLAVTLPVALLAVTLGGVTATQVLAVYCALVTWLLLLAHLGLVWSVICRTSANAASATVLTIILVPMSCMLLVLITGADRSPLIPAGKWLADQTVMARLVEILRTGYGGGVVGTGDVLHVALSALLFLAAWRLFPRFAVDTDGGEGGRPLVVVTGRRSWWRRLLGAGRPRPGLAAITWKDYHFLAGGRLAQLVWPMAIIILAAIIASMAGSNRQPALPVVAGCLMMTTMLLLPFHVGMLLSRLFSEERRLGTIDDLLVLPHAPTAMLYAKLRSIIGIVVPSLILFGVGVLLHPEAFTDGSRDFFRHGFGWAVIAVVLAFWHWCAYLSMRLKSGAFISAAVIIIGSLVLLSFVTVFVRFFRSGDLFMGFVVVLYGAQAIHLHILMRGRFRRMALD